MWVIKGAADSIKTKGLSKEKIKKQLLESIIINEVVESEELNQKAEEIQESEEAAEVIKQYEYTIKTREKGIPSIACYQGKVFKRYKEKAKFIKLVSQLGIHKNTSIFKINVFTLCERYPKLLWSSIGLGCLKNFHKNFKAVCTENQENFR